MAQRMAMSAVKERPAFLDRPEFQALRDTISYAEGTYDDRVGAPNYTVRYGDKNDEGTGLKGNQGNGSLDTTKPHPGDARPSPWGSSYSSAASGAHQWMPDTWNEMNDGNNVPMTPRNQNTALHKHLVERNSYDFDQPFDGQVHKLAPTWASFPKQNGASYHGQPVKEKQVLLDHYNERLKYYTKPQQPMETITPQAQTVLDNF